MQNNASPAGEKILEGNKLVWAWMENGDQSHSALHCYYSRQRLDSVGMYTRETHSGNSALCNKRFGVSEDGDSFLPIDKIKPSELDRNAACKRCLKIYDKRITPQPLTK